MAGTGRGGPGSEATHDKPTVPDPRVVFAAERTILAWIRTGLSLMGFGFVVARFGLFLRELEAAQHHAAPAASGFSLWIGTALVVLGVAVNLIAVRQHLQVIGRLNRGAALYPASASPGAAVAVVLAVLGIAIAAYLFVTGR